MPLTCANALCRTIFPHILRQLPARCRVTSCTAADQPKGPAYGHQQPSELASHRHCTTITRRRSSGTERGTGLFFVLFRSEDLLLTVAALLLLAGSSTSGEGLSSCGCNGRGPDRAGKESHEIIVADLTLGGTRIS
jgi:hypothetical protein